ncbi:MAG: hypothetical protein OQK61_07225 [Ignavibacteriaceae bacterium]|nr:hypothetical protein [Ignavibacteriaceae bacterium]
MPPDAITTDNPYIDFKRRIRDQYLSSHWSSSLENIPVKPYTVLDTIPEYHELINTQ